MTTGDEELTRYPYRGCGERMRPGDVVWVLVRVLVRAAGHAVSVPAHEEHRRLARASALEDKSWQRMRGGLYTG